MKQDPMDEWLLRDEILAAFHRWPVVVAFVLLGSLLGIVSAFLWPSSYKATTEISVDLNPYRALDDRYVSTFAGVDFRNIDDYKHWQMSQLSILIVSDSYLEETLNRLREKDIYWQDIGIHELGDIVEAQWRNAGRWLLYAEADTSHLAKDAVEAWRDVIIEKASFAITQSKELFKLELTLRSLNDEIVRLRTRQIILKEVNSALDEILAELNKVSTDEPLNQADRLKLSTLVFQTADFSSRWETLIRDFPEANATIQEYIAWISWVNAAIELDLKSTGNTIEGLEGELSELNSEWDSAFEDAQGLSATLSIENLSKEALDVNRVRPVGLVALVGGILGLLVWCLVFFAQITHNGYRR
jgi:hypothetical protein